MRLSSLISSAIVLIGKVFVTGLRWALIRPVEEWLFIQVLGRWFPACQGATPRSVSFVYAAADEAISVVIGSMEPMRWRGSSGVLEFPCDSYATL